MHCDSVPIAVSPDPKPRPETRGVLGGVAIHITLRAVAEDLAERCRQILDGARGDTAHGLGHQRARSGGRGRGQNLTRQRNVGERNLTISREAAHRCGASH